MLCDEKTRGSVCVFHCKFIFYYLLFLSLANCNFGHRGKVQNHLLWPYNMVKTRAEHVKGFERVSLFEV